MSILPEEFIVGQLVQLRANPTVIAAVVQVLPGQPEPRYSVFYGGTTHLYYASQLQYAPAIEQNAILPLAEFQGRLTALLLREPSLSTLYSLHAARINFVPYQFRPVLKLIRADRPRLLIADEVGVGKTIEAGLIMRELQSRRELSSVLILCPRPLVIERKWELEMKRFDEHFKPLDGPALRVCVAEADRDGVWPHPRSIIPFSLFDERLLFGDDQTGRRRKRGLNDLDPPPRFDLVIVDEAHHLRNNTTYVHRGVEFFCRNAEAVVFLSATPIQLGSNDLFTLLNLLRPDLVGDQASFHTQSAPNPFLHAAISAARSAFPEWQQTALSALQEAGRTEWGLAILMHDPIYELLTEQLETKTLTDKERLMFVRDVEGLLAFSPIISRTRRRDIGRFTTRKAETVSVPFTLAQQNLHDALLGVQARILARTHGDRAVGFLMTTLRRQAASCLYGLAPLIRQILSRRFDVLEWEEADDMAGEDFGADSLLSLTDEVEAVLEQAQTLDDTDPKLEALLEVVTQKQDLQNNKILLFSAFRHTLNYLLPRLAADGLRVGLIHGGVTDDERIALRERFSLPRNNTEAIDLLLSSEVGCEGLDYQFCDCLINYDLPWNPMRVEQRIGRIDRYGQKSDTVAIYNFVTPGTVDYDIYDRCLMRIGVFQQALGGSEEILGRLSDELRTVAESLELTAEERQSRLQQLADNEIRALQEQSVLEEREAELFGLTIPAAHMAQEVADASSPWLSAKSLQNLVQQYLTKTCGEGEYVLGAGLLKTLRLNLDARRGLLADLARLPRQASPVHREWDRWLRGGDQHLSVTFDAASAADRRESVFLTPIHPLLQQAALAADSSVPLRTVCRVQVSDISSGHYPFVLYQWRKLGVRDDAALQPVCATPVLTDQLLSLLETAEPADLSDSAFPESNVFDQLDSQHYALWSQVRDEHLTWTRRIAAHRRESLRISHLARVALLREQEQGAGNEKIRRMRGSQIAGAEADYTRRLADISDAEARADILTQAVAYGVLIVE